MKVINESQKSKTIRYRPREFKNLLNIHAFSYFLLLLQSYFEDSLLIEDFTFGRRFKIYHKIKNS